MQPNRVVGMKQGSVQILEKEGLDTGFQFSNSSELIG